jgi:hypothetical protein
MLKSKFWIPAKVMSHAVSMERLSVNILKGTVKDNSLVLKNFLAEGSQLPITALLSPLER